MLCPCCNRENEPAADFCECGHPFKRAGIVRRPAAPSERLCPACAKSISFSARKCPYCQTGFGLWAGIDVTGALIGLIGLACLFAMLYLLIKYRRPF